MNVEDVIDEIMADLAAGLVDKSDDEIIESLDKYNLDSNTVAEILDLVDDLRESEAVADENIDPLNIDAVDELADQAAASDGDAKLAEAQEMANEDDSSVTVTEEDKDDDGDPDKVTIEKDDAEDDSALSDEEKSAIDSLGEDVEEDSDNDDSEEDKPHDTNILSDSTQKNIIGTLSNFRW